MSRFVTTLLAPPPVPRPNQNPPAAYGPMPMGQASTPTSMAQMKGLNGGSGDVIPVMVELFKDAKAIFKANPVELFHQGNWRQRVRIP